MSEENTGSLWKMTGFAQVITLIGAGGKTTSLKALAQEIHRCGKQVIGTTTTKVYPMDFQGTWKDEVFPPPRDIESPCFWYATTTEDGPVKWVGPTGEVVDQAIRSRQSQTSDKAFNDLFWIIEGDGAREKQLKCWDTHEPQIPITTQCAVLVIPRGIWGKVLTPKEIHRPEKCPSLVGATWNDEKVAEYILNSPVFHPKYQQFFWVVLFNEKKVDPPSVDSPSAKKDTDNPLNPLESNLRQYLYQQTRRLSSHPAQLRIASGNVKEGTIRWFDMW